MEESKRAREQGEVEVGMMISLPKTARAWGEGGRGGEVREQEAL